MVSKEERLRKEGMEFCMRYLAAHDNDADALIEECRRRGVKGAAPLRVNRKDVEDFENRVRHRTIDTILIASMIALHDEFGFGKERLLRFRAMFNKRVEWLLDGTVSWTDWQRVLAEESGIELEAIRWNE